MPATYAYRVVELIQGDLRAFTLAVVYYNDAGKIVGSTDPELAIIQPVGATLDDLRAELHKVTQALEAEVMHVEDFPDHPSYVNQDQEQALSERDNPAEDLDDGSGPEVPDDAVEDSTADASPVSDNDSGNEAEPEPATVPVDDLGSPVYSEADPE